MRMRRDIDNTDDHRSLEHYENSKTLIQSLLEFGGGLFDRDLTLGGK